LEVLMFNDDEECLLLHGWRYSMAGKELLGLLKGEFLLGIEAEHLTIIENKAM